jgi:hypothetical protein
MGNVGRAGLEAGSADRLHALKHDIGQVVKLPVLELQPEMAGQDVSKLLDIVFNANWLHGAASAL